MTDQPKPCPHCGSAGIRQAIVGLSHVAYCKSCGVGTGFHYDAAEALAAWNRRTMPWVAVAERLPEPEQVCLWWSPERRKPLVSSYVEGLDTEFFTHWLPLSDDFFPAVDKLAQGGAGSRQS